MEVVELREPDAARFRPRLLELESRDVPAWWSVAAPSPAAGTVGVTDATHSGELQLASQYTPDAAGLVTVWADNAAGAVGQALTGTIGVTLADEIVEHTFGPETIGTSAADEKPFLVVVSGNTVSVAFEDMAGLDGCDYDYNDRTFDGGTASATSDPVVFEGGYTLTGGEANETASVALVVTLANPTEFLWTYTLTNNSLTYEYASWSPGIDSFFLTAADATSVTGLATTMGGWVSSVNAQSGLIGWRVPADGGGPYVAIGSSAEFSFRTPPQPVTPAQGGARLGGRYVGSRYVLAPIVPEGPVAGPGPNLKAKLHTVTFSGNTNFPIDADPGDPAFLPPPHWVDDNTNGAIDQQGERTLPVSFVRGDQVSVSAEFKITGGTAPGNIVFVRADGPGKYDVPWTPATIANGVITLPETKLAVPLTNNVDYIADFKFEWEVATFQFNGNVKTPAGKSTNEFFATLAAPAPPAGSGNYITPLWLFCSAAKGTNMEATAIPKAFDAYRGAAVKTHESLDPRRVDPSVPLHYYMSWGVQNETAALLLGSEKKDGKCQSWVDLFRFTLVEGGIPQAAFSKYIITNQINATKDLLFIKNWTFKSPGTPTNPGFTHINTFVLPPVTGSGYGLSTYAQEDAAGVWSYKWGANSEVTDEAGLNGQNTTNPLSLFNSHFVVRVGDTIYDPSYGTSFSGAGGAGISPWEAASRAWEAHSLAATAAVLSYDDNGTPRDKVAIYEITNTARNTLMLMQGW